MVPGIYTAIRDYIDASAQFIATSSTDLAWTELEDALNRSTNLLFTECLSGLLNSIIQAAETDLLRLIQLTINLTELEGACEHLQTYLHEHARPKFFAQMKVDEEQVDEVCGQISVYSATDRYGDAILVVLSSISLPST